MTPYSKESWSDPTSWAKVRRILRDARAELLESGFLPPSLDMKAIREKSGPEQELVEAAYRPHEKAVSQAIISRFETGSWRPLSPTESHYASIVIRYVGIFIAHICLETPSGGYATIFPFPEMSESELVIYLCTDWWRRIGWMDYVRDIKDRIAPFA